jgi:hypothetical protein
MAVFGHSGSQAPQLMHSAVIIVAIRADPLPVVGKQRAPSGKSGVS